MFSPSLLRLSRRFLPLLILLIGLVLFFATGLDGWLNFRVLAEHYTTLTAWIAGNRLIAWGGFFLIYLVAVAFSLPIASLLTLGGAALLGWAALPIVVFSATAGAFILFIAASGALQDSMQKRAGPFMERIRDGFNKSPFSGCSPCGWCRPFRSGWSISFRHCLAWAQDRFSSPPLSASPRGAQLTSGWAFRCSPFSPPDACPTVPT